MSQYKIFKRMLSKRTGRIETIEIATYQHHSKKDIEDILNSFLRIRQMHHDTNLDWVIPDYPYSVVEKASCNGFTLESEMVLFYNEERTSCRISDETIVERFLKTIPKTVPVYVKD